MLRGTRENISLLASISRCAGVVALCSLLLLTSVVVFPQNLHSPYSAYAQQPVEEDEGSTGTGAEDEGSTGTGAAEQATDKADVLATLKTVVNLAQVKDTDGLAEIAAVNDTEQLAEMTGSSDSEELAQTPGITSSKAVESIVEVPDVEGLANLVGVSPDKLPDIVLPEIPATDDNTGGSNDNTGGSNDNTGGSDNPSTGGSNDNTGGSDNPSTGGSNDNTGGSEEPAGDGAVDKSGVKELYPTASNGPTWYIREQKDPTADGHFYYGMYKTTTIKYLGSGVWQVDARSGTQEHGIRMHVDSPTGKWKNTEMTGYFNIEQGDDQFTMIARHGPSYHDNGGCEAYGYYALTEVNGNVFFKKKLYHFNNGYTKRLASVSALGDIHDKWIGMKFVVYDLPNGDVKLELWIDKGDMTNNWKKETELIDKGNLPVEGGDDCGRQATDKIDSGTRVSYRADNSLFDFKKLSVREINAGG